VGRGYVGGGSWGGWMKLVELGEAGGVDEVGRSWGGGMKSVEFSNFPCFSPIGVAWLGDFVLPEIRFQAPA